jgi:hypothetical protein
MPLIAPQKKHERLVFAVKLDVRLIAMVKAYAECITSTQEYVTSQALLTTFAADRDFHTWLEHDRPSEAEALEELLAERPATARRRRPVRRIGSAGRL